MPRSNSNSSRSKQPFPCSLTAQQLLHLSTAGLYLQQAVLQQPLQVLAMLQDNPQSCS
jgi:hypothetical protein